MDIVINKHQEKILEAFTNSPLMRNKLKKIDKEKADLENYIETHGEFMTDVTNNKTYLVQYLKALSQLVGREYAVCAPVRQDGTYGAFYVKPWNSFKKNYNNPTQQNGTVIPVKKNLYQEMGYFSINDM